MKGRNIAEPFTTESKNAKNYYKIIYFISFEKIIQLTSLKVNTLYIKVLRIVKRKSLDCDATRRLRDRKQ